MKIKSKFLREYFNFSKREKNGFFVLIGILLIILITKQVVLFNDVNANVDFLEFENEIDVFMSYQTYDLENSEPFYFDPNTAETADLLKLGLSPKSVNAILNYREKGGKFYKPEDFQRVYELSFEEYEHVKDFIHIPKKSYSSNYSKYNNYNKEFAKDDTVFTFDPNTASKDDFISLGLREWQAENIIKYREKGGFFSSAEDFSKIYGLEKDLFEKLLPYIEIDEANNNTNSYNPDVIVDINAASELDFQQISGIGPSYSKRIVKYRDKLGGFLSIDQIKEVYGMTDELFLSIEANLAIETIEIAKININTADFKELISHPYIDKENTINILNYREFAVEIIAFSDLLDQKAISLEFYNKLSPYITTK